MLLLWLSHLAFVPLIQGSGNNDETRNQTSTFYEITAHLIGGSTDSYGAWGLLELTVKGERVTVQPEPWTNLESLVACRHLGYSDVISTMVRTRAELGNKITNSKLDLRYQNIKCNGNERELSECDFSENTNAYYSDSGVILYCFIKESAVQVVHLSGGQHRLKSEFIGEIEMVGSLSSCGGLECFKSGEYRVAEANAHVLCLTVNKPFALIKKDFSVSKSKTFSYVCSGNEAHIRDCPYKYIKGYIESVYCTEEMTLKFERRQMLAVINSQEYAIGGLDWDDAAAAVACRSLGIKGTATLGTEIDHHPKYDRIVSQRLLCQGNENDLFECTEYETFIRASNKNSVYEAISVSCGGKRPEVELTMKVQSRTVGRVQALVDGMLGCVCDYGWSEKAARVACSMIGRGSGQVIALLDASAQGLGEKEEYELTWVRYTYCKGDEKHLWDCLGDVYPYEASPCPDDHLAGIVCDVTKTAIHLILAGGSHSGEGRVVVTIDGVAGSIGWQDWDEKDATVVCKMLGFTNSSAVSSVQTEYGSNEGPLYFDNVPCTGKEDHILDCFSGKLGWTTKKPPNADKLVAGVDCTASPLITDTANDGTILIVSAGVLAALLLVSMVVMILFVIMYYRHKQIPLSSSPSDQPNVAMVNTSRAERKDERASETYEDLDEIRVYQGDKY